MLIEFDKIETAVIPHMRGGEKTVSAQMFTDSMGKIMRGRLIPGASIGLHTHETSSEVIYVLSGSGKVLCGGGYEPLTAGASITVLRGRNIALSTTVERISFFSL